MSKIARWVTLALFCAACGFGGSVGGLALMRDDLRGERGERGEAGTSGPTGMQGPPGPTGPAGPPADLVGLTFDLDRLDKRLNALENAEGRCYFRTQLVTGVSLRDTYGGLVLDVDETPWLICLNPSS